MITRTKHRRRMLRVHRAVLGKMKGRRRTEQREEEVTGRMEGANLVQIKINDEWRIGGGKNGKTNGSNGWRGRAGERGMNNGGGESD